MINKLADSLLAKMPFAKKVELCDATMPQQSSAAGHPKIAFGFLTQNIFFAKEINGTAYKTNNM
jgi:hypothetical protein